ncbi:MAG: tetratricopeptide repeat protein [Deltaproteobacteria bacterium]|nr:tetratricopeptide repeat protein [Deltaproteobacteria bacterium]
MRSCTTFLLTLALGASTSLPSLKAEDAKALALLKRDDERSIAKAVEAWKKLEATAPEYVPFLANQLIASVFLTQELRDDIRHLEARYNELNRQREKLETRKEPADWLDRAKRVREEMSQIKAKSLVKKLGAAGDAPAFLRASALYYGCRGIEAAEKVAEVYSTVPDKRDVLHDPVRAFADLAVAARFAQPRVTPGDRDKAVAAAEAALKKDPHLLRAYLFLAKIYLANHEFVAARTEVDKLLKLNPEHKAAARLKAEIHSAEEDAAAQQGAENSKE